MIFKAKVGFAQIFGESGKIVRRIDGNDVARDNRLDLVRIQQSRMNRAYAGIVYSYKFSSLLDPLCTLRDMFCTGIYV